MARQHGSGKGSSKAGGFGHTSRFALSDSAFVSSCEHARTMTARPFARRANMQARWHDNAMARLRGRRLAPVNTTVHDTDVAAWAIRKQTARAWGRIRALQRQM